MNRVLCLFLVAAAFMASSPAFASKARLIALGQSTTGSRYLFDNRNIFLNPAELGLLKEQVNFEWGTNLRPESAATTSSVAGEGGVITSFWGGNMALHLGRVPQLSENLRLINNAAASGGSLSEIRTAFGMGATTFLEPQDAIDLAYGNANGSVKWGLGVMYGQGKQTTATNTNDKARVAEARAGIHSGDVSVYSRANFMDRSEKQVGPGNTVHYKADFGGMAGGSLDISDTKKVLVEAFFQDYDLSNTNNIAKYEGQIFSARGGLAGVREMQPGARFIYAGEAAYYENRAKSDRNTIQSERLKTVSLPVTIGVEADAALWLKLRGSVTQNFILDSTKKTVAFNTADKHVPGTTVVGAGAGLAFNRFTLDGTFAGATTGTLNGAQFLSNLSMNYVF